MNSKIIDRIKSESHTRLYLIAINILKKLDKVKAINNYIDRFIDFISYYPVDLMIGIMKEMKRNYSNVYEEALNNDKFIDTYFKVVM